METMLQLPLTPRPPYRGEQVSEAGCENAPPRQWTYRKPKVSVPVQVHGPYQLRPVIGWPSSARSPDSEGTIPPSTSVLTSQLSLDALVELVSWRRGSVVNPVEVARAVVGRAIYAAAYAQAPSCSISEAPQQETSRLGLATVGTTDSSLLVAEDSSEATSSDPVLEPNAVPGAGVSLPRLADGDDACWGDTSDDALEDEAEVCTRGIDDVRGNHCASDELEPVGTASPDFVGGEACDVHGRCGTSGTCAAAAVSCSVRGAEECECRLPAAYSTADMASSCMDSSWVSEVTIDEVRCRRTILHTEALRWLWDIVAPAADARHSEPLKRFFVREAACEAVDQADEAQRLCERFRLDMCPDVFGHVVALESVHRAFDVVDVEADARRVLWNRRCLEHLVFQGLEPLRSALRSWVHRRRSRRAAVVRQWRRLLESEEAQRRDVVRAYVRETAAYSAALVSAEERYYRTALLHVYAATVTTTAHSWVWLHQRCSLFTLCFAHALLGAPKMSGRVCDASLFHTLSLRESFLREQLQRQENAFRVHVANLVIAVGLSFSVEPEVRRGIEAEESEAWDLLVALFVHVTRMYQRRDVEHAEYDERMWFELQWRRTVNSMEQSFRSALEECL